MGYRYDGTFVPTTAEATTPLTGKKIAFLGDSLTEQSVGHDNTGFVYDYFHKITPNHPNKSGWGRIIVEKYGMDGIEHGKGSQMWRCPSDRPNGAVTAVKRLVASPFEPDYIVLEYGSNDINGGSTGMGTVADSPSDAQDASTYASMRWCIETLQSTYPSAIILVVGPVIRKGRGTTNDARQKEYIPNALYILNEYGVPMVDMLGSSGISADMMNPDHLHLAIPADGGGYDNDRESVRRYAQAIENALLNDVGIYTYDYAKGGTGGLTESDVNGLIDAKLTPLEQLSADVLEVI